MVYAINSVAESWRETVYQSLRKGEGRFGWSWGGKNCDLRLVRKLMTEGKPLSGEQKESYRRFLLELQDGDYAVYINLTGYGQCTLARVTGTYYYRNPEEMDFNHCFPVDPESIRTFPRNSRLIPTDHLVSRLKLQGRYWRIYDEEDFYLLLERLDQSGGETEPSRTAADTVQAFSESIRPELDGICKRLHFHAPNFSLEKVLEMAFRKVRNVLHVENKHGLGDKGADLIVTYSEGLDIPGLQAQRTCLVQVKSYQGEMDDPSAVSGIGNAFAFYDADCALIVSTAESVSERFLAELERLRKTIGRPVGLLYGAELSRFILKYLI